VQRDGGGQAQRSPDAGPDEGPAVKFQEPTGWVHRPSRNTRLQGGWIAFQRSRRMRGIGFFTQFFRNVRKDGTRENPFFPGSHPDALGAPAKKVRWLSPPDLNFRRFPGRPPARETVGSEVERVLQSPAHALFDAGEGEASVRLIAGCKQVVLLADALDVELYAPVDVAV
jgi:hypothetical protein